MIITILHKMLDMIKLENVQSEDVCGSWRVLQDNSIPSLVLLFSCRTITTICLVE